MPSSGSKQDSSVESVPVPQDPTSNAQANAGTGIAPQPQPGREDGSGKDEMTYQGKEVDPTVIESLETSPGTYGSGGAVEGVVHEGAHGKASLGDKIKGTIEEIEGKMKGDQSLVNEGRDRKAGKFS